MDEKLLKKAAAVVRAKRQIESGGDYAARGGSGEYGAYQYMPETWKASAKKYLGDENAPIQDKRNQDRVELLKTVEQLNSGYKIPEIFAEHNSGSRTGWENKRGVNKYGQAYDVPAYVRKGSEETLRQIQAITGRQVPTGVQSVKQPQVTQQPEEDKMGLGKSLLRGLGAFPVKAALTLAAPFYDNKDTGADGIEIKKGLFKGMKDLTSQVQDAATEAATKYKSGQISGIKAGVQVAAPIFENILDFASIIPISGAAQAAKTAVTTGIRQTAKNTARGLGQRLATNTGQGALFGAGYSAIDQMKKDDSTVGSTLGAAAVGGLTGGALGYVIPAVASRVTKVGRGLGAMLVPDSVLGKTEQSIAKENYVNALKTFTEDKAIGKQVAKINSKLGKDADVISLMAERAIFPDVEGRKVVTMKQGGAVDRVIADKFKLVDQVGEIANNYSDKTITLDDLEKSVTSAIRNDTDIQSTGEMKKALNEAKSMIESYRESYGDVINTPQVNNIRKGMNRKTSAFGKEVFQQDVDNIFADIARQKLDEMTGDETIRSINKEVRNLMAVEKFLTKLDGQVANYGRMSQYMARMLGALIASPSQGGNGMLGPILGALGGDFVVRLLQSNTLTGPIQRKLLRQIATDETLQKTVTEKLSKSAQQQFKRMLEKEMAQAPLGLPAPSGKPLTQSAPDFTVTATGEAVPTVSNVVPRASGIPTTKAVGNVEQQAKKVYQSLSRNIDTNNTAINADTGIIPSSIPQVPTSINRVARTFAEKGKTYEEYIKYIAESPLAADIRKDIKKYAETGGEDVNLRELFNSYIVETKPVSQPKAKKEVKPIGKKKEKSAVKLSKEKPKEVIEFEAMDENDPRYDEYKSKYKDILLKYYSQ